MSADWWRHDPPGPGRHGHRIVDQDGCTIASVNGDEGYGVAANRACVMAAAPQMLRALKALSEFARPVNWAEADDTDPDAVAAWVGLDQAILAAEGQREAETTG